MMIPFNPPSDPLYDRARLILQQHPDMGKNELGRLLGIRAPSSRLRIVRFRGETQGHSTHPDYQRVRALKEQHLDWGAPRIAQTLGLTLDHVRLHLARWIGALSYQGAKPTTLAPESKSVPPDPTLSRDNALEDTVHDGQRDLSYRGTRIQTLEGLLAFAKVDLEEWQVERHTINKWEVAAKTAEGMATTFLFQIKAWLSRRVVETRLKGFLDALQENLRREAPIRPALVHRPGAKGLLEISIMDHHFGKYCSAAETGRAYDPDIAERMFTTALEDLLHKAAHQPVEKVLMVCGNDYFNTDFLGRTTTAGTPQDEAVRHTDSFARGRVLLVRAIDRLRQVAPVQVLMVSGNHDTQRLYYLGHVLEAHFHKTPDVQVENGPQPRKYFQYHHNLIGFTHGNNEKHFDLPLLLATEQPDAWAACPHREFHLGHFHSRKLKMFVPSADRAGILVRILPSLCPPDAWHTAMGYRSRLAAEALYFDPKDGCVASFTHHAS